MIKYLVIALLLVSSLLSVYGTKYDKYNWNSIPEALINDTVRPVDGVKITFERRIKEVYLNEENYFEEIIVFHRRIRVETHNAIDNYNKIYVPVSNVIEILNIKARSVSPNGKVTELLKDNIKELENLEDKGDYKIFAIEGSEIGGEIEYFYTLRTKFSAYQGVWMQGEEPRQNVEVIHTFPSKLEYIIKSYNGFPDFTTIEDDSTGITTMQVKVGYIKPLADEEYSNYKANLMRYEYTLAYNSYVSSLRVYSFSKLCNTLYSNLYQLTKNETSAIASKAKEFEVNGYKNEKKIRAIENWIKSEISISNSISNTPTLNEILEYKQTSKFGATRLFVAILNQLNIPFELVITTNKNNREFDPEFNAWNFLDDYLIYFSDIDLFIVPDDPNIRLGVNAFGYQGSYGLFLHPIKYNDKLGSMAYQIKKLPVTPCANSRDSLLVNIVCDLSMMKTEAIIHREMTGALAYSFQSFWEGINEERIKEVIANVFDMGDKNIDIISYSVKNGSRTDIGLNPIIMDVNMKVNSLIESAGDDFIVNIGRVIGTQSQLYQDKERKLPIDIDFSHGFYRRIDFKVPEGYKITNLDDIKIKAEMVENGVISAYFSSWYELNGNNLSIFSLEKYPEINYPISQFNEFKEVINAAADFNKKTLILSSQ